MCSRRPNRRALVAWTVAAVVAVLALSSSAVALSPPTVTMSPASPSAANDWTFTFSSSADPLTTITGYEGGVVLSPTDEPTAPIASPFTDTSPKGEGSYWFRVRAVQSDGTTETRSGYATVPFVIDRTAPAPPVARFDPPQPNGRNGWYRSLTIRWSCSDPSGASCPDTVVKGAERGKVETQRAIDGAGNVSAPTTTTPFDFDDGAFQPAISSPSNGALVAGEPTYRWVAITRDTSGNDHFEVWARWGGGSYQQIARAAGTATQTTRNVRAAALPEGVVVTWFVRFYDIAGNSRDSAARNFTIDPTPPSAAPVITGGPAGPTSVAAPTFSWTGDQPRFSWAVTRAGESTPLQSKKGVTDKQVTLDPLPDGEYTFSVSQVTTLGAVGPEASQAFTVDTARPPAPVITARPAAPTAVPAGFAWTTEPGAFSRWQVLDASGAVLRGPSDALDPVVNVGALASGGYTFRVVQIDPAGNVSDATSESFSVQLPLGTVATAKPPRIALPKQNAGRLTPRAGTRIATLRPVFRWKRGPAGTTLYNLQLFRVVKREAGKAPSIKKVVSVFPRGLRWKTRSRVAPGQCYVWRVWPYTGASFTPKPLGISNFCVMSAKALTRSKARARARHQAAALRVG